MSKVVVVHTRAAPGDPLAAERESLDAPDVDLSLRGPCRTPEEVLEAVRDADVAMCVGEPPTREVFAGASPLKMVFRYGVGAGPSSNLDWSPIRSASSSRTHAPQHMP